MRGRLIAMLGAAAALAALAGCGATERENRLRPPIPATVSVTVNRDSVRIDPIRVGTPGSPRPEISQNERAPSPLADPKKPAVVNVTASNTTNRDTRLILTGPEEYVSPPLVGNGSTSFNEGLAPGVYMVRSSASARPARLVVGVARPSSANDVLLP